MAQLNHQKSQKPYRKREFDDLSCFYPADTDRLIRLDRLPRYGYGAEKNKYIMYMQQSQLVYQAYIQPHRSGNYRDVITIDVDSELDIQKLLDAGIPLPATIVGRPLNSNDRHAARDACRPWTRRPHLRWLLKIPVSLPRDGMSRKELSSARRQRYLYNRIRDELIRRIEELGFKVDHQEPVITKNPVSDEWHVVEGDVREWTLYDLKNVLGLEDEVPGTNSSQSSDAKKEKQQRWYQCDSASAGRNFRSEYALQGRTCMLFETVRGLAYAYKSQCSSYEQMYTYVLQQCIRVDREKNLRDPLPQSKIRSTAKSIARWTWEVYRGLGGDGKDRGSCYQAGLVHTGMSPAERQSVGGRYGSQKRAGKAQERVLKARAEWTAAGKDVTISGLARELRMDRKTVRKYLAEQPVANDNTPVSRGGEQGVHKGPGPHRKRLGDQREDSKITGIKDSTPIWNPKISDSDIPEPNLGGDERAGAKPRALRDVSPAPAGTSRPTRHDKKKTSSENIVSLADRKQKHQPTLPVVPKLGPSHSTYGQVLSYKRAMQGEEQIYRDPTNPDQALTASGAIIQLSEYRQGRGDVSELPVPPKKLLDNLNIHELPDGTWMQIPF